MNAFISDDLRALCNELLTQKDLMEVATLSGFSYAYVKEVKNQRRYNADIEIFLISQCRKAWHIKEYNINDLFSKYEHGSKTA
jgi:hypothetical protein